MSQFPTISHTTAKCHTYPLLLPPSDVWHQTPTPSSTHCRDPCSCRNSRSLTPHTSHLKPHTSHLTPPTSHLTPHACCRGRRRRTRGSGAHGSTNASSRCRRTIYEAFFSSNLHIYRCSRSTYTATCQSALLRWITCRLSGIAPNITTAMVL